MQSNLLLNAVRAQSCTELEVKNVSSSFSVFMYRNAGAATLQEFLLEYVTVS